MKLNRNLLMAGLLAAGAALTGATGMSIASAADDTLTVLRGDRFMKAIREIARG